MVVAQDYTPVLKTYNQTRTVVLVAWVVVLLLLARLLLCDQRQAKISRQW